MKTILIYSESDLTTDPRVMRQISTLKNNYKVIGLGTKVPERSEVKYKKIDSHGIAAGTSNRFKTIVRRFGFEYAIAYTTCWVLEKAGILFPLKDVLERMVIRKRSGSYINAIAADLIIANDLSALAICVANARGRPVLYDAHEYSPGQYPSNKKTRGRRKYSKYILKKYLPKVSGFITVGRKIAERYRKEYYVDPVIILNAPEYKNLVPSKIVKNRIRLVHHGIAARGRFLEKMIETVKLLDKRFELDFYLMSNDPGYLQELKNVARNERRIRFLAPVPMLEIAEILNEYDIGIYLLPPTCTNQRLALPNKIFEFIQARLAIAIGPSPEMALLVNEKNIGVIADSFEPESMAKAMNKLDEKKIEKFKENSHKCALEFSAETNAKILEVEIERILREHSA